MKENVRTKSNESDDKEQPVDGAKRSSAFGRPNCSSCMRNNIIENVVCSIVSVYSSIDCAQIIVETIPLRCCVGKKCKVHKPEDNGKDFEAEMRPVQVDCRDPERGDEYLQDIESGKRLYAVASCVTHISQKENSPRKNEEAEAWRYNEYICSG
jgi:hypothetical protein